MDKSYEVQVLIDGEWKGIRPTGGDPYRFKTFSAADWHLVRSYPVFDQAGNIIRKVVEVNKPSNISLE